MTQEEKQNVVIRLWKVYIKTYYFKTLCYDLFVLADTESNMLKTVYKYLSYNRDKDAKIVKYEEIDLNDSENRVL